MDLRLENMLQLEQQRQDNTIELIASENFASKSVMQLCGSVFTNKYAEGYPGHRYYNGCTHMDEAETLAIQTCTALYGAQFANVQSHSGANANTAVYQALLKPGDTILGMDLASGGHLSHGAAVNQSGKLYTARHYGVNDQGWLDYDHIHDLAMQLRPRLIIAGASAYPRIIDFAKFRAIADAAGALLMVDMSHYSGLIAGKAYPNPMMHAHVVTSTTHKTLRGPRGGIILWNNAEYTKSINAAIFPGTQGGPLMHIIAAKAQAFIEAAEPTFAAYAHDVVHHAQVMCEVFLQHGLHVLTQGTDSHIVLLDLSKSQCSGRQVADMLEQHGITVNKNGIPNDARSFKETSGIRLGTAAETTRGHDATWFAALAKKIALLIQDLQQ